MDEEKLRTRLAKDAGVPSIDPAEWDELVDDRYVQEALDGGYERGYDDLLGAYRKILGRPKRRAAGRSEAVEFDPRIIPLSQAERDRAIAVSNALALRADRLDEVQEFRRKVLSSKPLTEDEARGFVRSVALGAFTLVQLTAWSIPLRDHRATLVDSGFSTSANEYLVDVRIEPPDLIFTRSVENVARLSDLPFVAYPNKASKPDAIQVLPGSLLDGVRRLALGLSARYWWQQEYSAEFLLTGKPPMHVPIRAWTERGGSVEYHRATIRIDAEPWVSADTIAATYRKLQQIMHGKDNKPVSNQQIAVVECVEAMRHRFGPDVPMAAMYAEWNEKVDEQYRYSNVYKFQRAYENAAGRLFAPGYHLPGDGHIPDADAEFFDQAPRGRFRWEPL